jgi:hypothetical protein
MGFKTPFETWNVQTSKHQKTTFSQNVEIHVIHLMFTITQILEQKMHTGICPSVEIWVKKPCLKLKILVKLGQVIKNC